ncbi:hypothetical protein SAMN04487947_1373 [Halogeometricum rufum]|jgi:hypothetical protein|uniref:Uncharacterized protein n=1 Tax=Halogeometricum rufum TaxID=553469 RepID=A0A1I6GM14_9EURY|nr:MULTISPECIES: hypothetical protein [Halogeometricum]SFR43272.1 hypothetical protein SAMN04487947_1373 [Halogeometricum rufum]
MERLDGEELDGPDSPDSTVAAHQSSPERTVFTEQGNRDAWISLDAESTVELER